MVAQNRSSRLVQGTFALLFFVAIAFLVTWGDFPTAWAGSANVVYLPLVMRPSEPTATPTPTVTPSPTPTKTPPAGWSAFEARVVELTNQQRANNGCSVMLTMNDKLHTAAYNHSADMIARDFFSHTNPDGKNPGARLNDVGYSWSGYGENIAAGYSSPESVVDGWMNSSGHRANILNCNFTEIGVGYAYAASDPGSVSYHHYWTQVFAKPR
jgi:uncharacterized protein YkwD